MWIVVNELKFVVFNRIKYKFYKIQIEIKVLN